MTPQNSIYFIYDGECPICNYAAHALRIKQAVGNLGLINARTEPDHPLIREVNERHLDLDEGMIISYQGNFYHGSDALNLLGLIGTDAGWFNKMNALLFRSKPMAGVCYPAMRGMRNLLIRMKGVPKIGNLSRKSAPIFKDVFGADWDSLPPVMKKHYANRPFQNDKVTTEGVMKVESSVLGRLLTPFFRMAGTLVPYEGENIPATVHFISTTDSGVFQFDRTFHFPDKLYRFHSRMKPIRGNELVEFMRFRLGWRMAYSWNGGKVILTHRGYVLDLFGFLLPLPIGLILGKGYAEETPINDNEFSMMMDIRHPLWGKVYGYSGTFRIVKEA